VCGTLWMVFHIFAFSQGFFALPFHNRQRLKEALPLNSIKCYFETTPFLLVNNCPLGLFACASPAGL
ncbi:MAG: hypothetical protein SPI93_04905, partial [Oscillospiraceae bacterium]|nr:hypothetical protein [Oscillospiraceae bacterium]